MFFSDFPSESEIIVPDVDAGAFQVMINSISGREVILNAANVVQVYYAAEKYDLQLLRQVCQNFLLNSIDSTNALDLLNKFHHYNVLEINEKCLSIILDDPLKFFKKPEFLAASIGVVRSIFKPASINCSVQDVESALLDWMTKKGVENCNKDNLFESVETHLQIKREELEMKMMRQHLFQNINHSMTKDYFTVTSIVLEKIPVFLHGFGLVLGKVPQETIKVYIVSNRSFCCVLEDKNVIKKGLKDVVSIQNFYFEKIPILHRELQVNLFFEETKFPRPCIQYNKKNSFVSHLILSNMH
jgi:BTB/POZ domain